MTNINAKAIEAIRYIDFFSKKNKICNINGSVIYRPIGVSPEIKRLYIIVYKTPKKEGLLVVLNSNNPLWLSSKIMLSRRGDSLINTVNINIKNNNLIDDISFLYKELIVKIEINDKPKIGYVYGTENKI